MLALRSSLRSILFVLVALCAACNRDYTIELPNGYFVARVYSGAFGIVRPDNRFVTELSKQGIALAVAGDIVMGEIDPSPPNHPDARGDRHFVINTNTNEAWLNLSRKQYLDRLRLVGIASPPGLIRVDRFVTLHRLRTAV